jgi:hypothetical protein
MANKVSFIFLSLFVISSFSCIAFAGETIYVTEKEYGDQWPFTVTEGQLGCIGGSRSIIFIANGKTYAVNGMALNQAGRMGWSKIDEIWKKNPQIPGAGISIGTIIDKGLSLCN